MRLWLSRLFRSWFSHPDLVSATWLRQQKQGEREVYEGVSVRGPFYREGA